jgi:beta-glucanase (GH16 family)
VTAVIVCMRLGKKFAVWNVERFFMTRRTGQPFIGGRRDRPRRRAVALLGCLVGVCAATLAAPTGWRTLAVAGAQVGVPTWSDEFNGLSLDLTRWSHRATGPRHDGILTPDAVSVGGGVLTIKTYTQAGRHYSGMIGTQKVGSVGFEQTYGYFEARVKFNSSPGQWSAFWLHSPTFGNPVGDPETAGVEMDVAEHRRRCVTAPSPTPPETCGPNKDISNRIQQALIWDGYGADSKAAVKLSDPLAGLSNGSWHTWALRWTPTDLTFYYDGAGIWLQTSPISRRSQYMILSSEVGAFFAGAIPRTGYGSRQTSTTNMQVDYVRVWSLS